MMSILSDDEQSYSTFIPYEEIEVIPSFTSIRNRLSDKEIKRLILEKYKSRFGPDFNQDKRIFENEPISLEIKLEENK